MPWKVNNAVDQRKQLFIEYQQGEQIAELGRRYGVSRQTVYKWLERYSQQGEDGLQDRTSAPGRHPQQCSEAIRERVLQLRQQHTRWSPRKLRAYLQARRPEQHWPAASTIGDWLREEGLAHARRRRRRTPPMSQPLSHAQQPNQLWCADFKGWFRTKDGERIDPLTVTDAATRYLLRCVSVDKSDGPHVRAVMEAAFREFGLPQAIRTDNGPPFASPAPAGLSRLAMWWIRLGIRHERIEPGEPQQNGRHERMHLTLKQETASPPGATRAAQQRMFLSFQEIYNQQRPHEALHYATPQDLYQPSPRVFPSRLPELAFPAGAVLRRVAMHGDVKWRGERLFISEVLAHEPLGLVRSDDRYWAAYYGPVLLGWLDDHKRRFLPAHRPPPDLQSDQG
jgi:transposase InsO family protein